MRRAALLVPLVLATAGCRGEPAAPFLQLEVVGPESGFRFRHELPGGRMDNLPKATMGGLAVIDHDGDGRMDLYFVNGGWHPELAGTARLLARIQALLEELAQALALIPGSSRSGTPMGCRSRNGRKSRPGTRPGC